MPIIIFIVGGVFIMASINGTVKPLLDQASKDLFPSKDPQSNDMGFLLWAGAIILLAMTLRAVDLPTAGKYLMVLVLISFALENQGILGSLLNQLKGLHAPNAAGTAGSDQPLASPLMGKGGVDTSGLGGLVQQGTGATPSGFPGITNSMWQNLGSINTGGIGGATSPQGTGAPFDILKSVFSGGN